MKKRISQAARSAVRALTLLLTTAAVILIFAAAALFMETERGGGTGNESGLPLDVSSGRVKPDGVQDTAVPKKRYMVTLSNGELRIASASEPGKYTVLRGIDPRTLRTADREALESGWELDSEEELAQFLEDFGS